MEDLLFEKSRVGRKGYSLPKLDVTEVPVKNLIPEKFLRHNELRLPEMSEIDVVRHFIKLSTLNFCIEHGLYPLGSCTMKYNPKINEKAASLPGFSELHPCSDDSFAQGALKLMFELGEYLKEISGFQGVTLQPSAGSNGEFAGIMMVRAYHLDRGDVKRDKILIPDSAHGTNPSSAAIAGFQTVSIKSLPDGRVDLSDLAIHCKDDVAGFMLTNPNTIGVFENQIVEIGELVHGCGGLMYMDGANLNALLGIVRPGDMGFDCMHINLHKTFSTPHGGGGPGSGPVCVNEKLIPYLPIPQLTKNGDTYALNMDCPKTIGKVHSFFGNFGVFVRAYTYIRTLGPVGIREISENAIINANYLMTILKEHFLAPYDEYCMHECVLSGDIQKEKYGVSTKDMAKRLLDYGFHAPTIYFPLIVHEAMLVEPTETESLESLDSFAKAMIMIAEEAKTNKEALLNAPMTTPVRRVDDALAARNLNITWFGKNK
jgi:glycine dehydrogenase subunit 2